MLGHRGIGRGGVRGWVAWVEGGGRGEGKEVEGCRGRRWRERVKGGRVER